MAIQIQGGPAINVVVDPSAARVEGGSAIPVAVVTGRAVTGNKATRVVVVTNPDKVEGGPAIPVVAAAAGDTAVEGGPALRVYVVQGVLGASAPVNTVLPSISGTVAIGQTLTATTGTWTNSPSSYSYQWKRNGADIGGATASTYVLTASDPGTTITVAVTATNAGGSASATSAGTSVPSVLGSLTAYWQLEEASGTRIDATGRGNDLSPTNTPGNAAGRINNAVDLVAASTQQLSRASTADLQASASGFTFAFWAKPNGNQAQDAGIAKWGTDEYRVHTPTAATLNMRFQAKGTDLTYRNTGNITLTNAAWNFVVAWYDNVGNTLNISLNNGAAVSVSAGGVAIRAAADIFRIGSAVAGSWNGQIDEVGVWARVLTAGERTALYNGGNGVTYPFLGL